MKTHVASLYDMQSYLREYNLKVSLRCLSVYADIKWFFPVLLFPVVGSSISAGFSKVERSHFGEARLL